MQNKAKNYNFSLSLLAPAFILGLFLLLPLATGALAVSMSPEGVISLVNAARQEIGLAPLHENTLLQEAATAKAKDMIKNDYFAHNSPEGRTPWYWFKKAGYNYKYAGENLAINYTNANEQQAAWMKSDSHRANILNENYREIGVAVIEGKIDGKSSLVTVQMFGTDMVAVADKTTPATLPLAESLLVSGEVKGMETVENMASVGTALIPENFMKAARQASGQAQGSLLKNTLFNIVVALLILTILAAPFALLVRSGSIIRRTFSQIAEESLISVAVALSIRDSLKTSMDYTHV